jgi:hypothetical protein
VLAFFNTFSHRKKYCRTIHISIKLPMSEILSPRDVAPNGASGCTRRAWVFVQNTGRTVSSVKIAKGVSEIGFSEMGEGGKSVRLLVTGIRENAGQWKLETRNSKPKPSLKLIIFPRVPLHESRLWRQDALRSSR